MIYIIIDTKGNDYGAIESFQIQMTKLSNYDLKNVSELLDSLQDGSSVNRGNIYDSLESHTFQTKEEFNSFVDGLESVSTHDFDTYKVFYIDVSDENESNNTNTDDPYYLFIILELGRCYGVLDSDTEYDNLWSEALKLREEFLNSEYNVEDKSEYDCISNFCQDYAQNMNTKKKDEVEKILIQKITSLGMDIPNNLEDIVQYCFEDILECADKDNWSDGDVTIAFRRWIEGEYRTD